MENNFKKIIERQLTEGGKVSNPKLRKLISHLEKSVKEWDLALALVHKFADDFTKHNDIFWAIQYDLGGFEADFESIKKFALQLTNEFGDM